MLRRKPSKTIQNFFRQIWKLHTALLKWLIKWFLRSLLVIGRKNHKLFHLSSAGFVLPTTVLLLLVMSLTVTALLFRSLSQTEQVIGEIQQQTIYNTATPAIDRAKSKLENIFTNDERYPGGVPPENFLAYMMQDARYNLPGKTSSERETRLDLDGNPATVDNAWAYQDTDRNTIAYSILMKTQGQVGASNVDYQSSNLTSKAKAMVVRTGPISTVQLTNECKNQTNEGSEGSSVENGWFNDSSSSSFLRKTFQVNAVVIDKNTSAANRASATLELQQERKVDRGNKWGAWFRNDLEIFPGPAFNWNGALHTEGSLLLGSDKLRAYLISAPDSCLYGKDGLEASEISTGQTKNKDGQIDFQGQIVSGRINKTDNVTFVDSSSTIHRSPTASTQLKKAEDSVKDAGLNPLPEVADIVLNPLSIFTQNRSRSRYQSDPHNTTVRDTQNWDNKNPLTKGTTARVFTKSVPPPYVDDTYRADNRYGPKLPRPKTPDTSGLPSGKRAGDPIEATDNLSDVSNDTYSGLVENTPPTDNREAVGLDGYWERRGRSEGVRIIVGQRLELGNTLNTPTALPTRAHEALQRRTLKDNLAAVQATALYHFQNDGSSNNGKDFPIACIATTVHPGTAETLKRSSTFEAITFKNSSNNDVTLYNDFFTGRGTNGWEYNVPTIATFNANIGNSSSSLRKALQNLAFFGGDPNGAYPAKQDNTSTSPSVIAVPAAGAVTHPLPQMTKWGDFSNLRQALNSLAASGYSDLSPADKSYLQTATCGLGILADNVKRLQDFTYLQSFAANVSLFNDLNNELSSNSRYPSGTPRLKIIQDLENNTGRTDLVQLARLIYLKEQVAWDRRNGGSCSIPPTYGVATVHITKLCATALQYEALHYIFPDIARGESVVGNRTPNTYISNINSGSGRYQAISDTDLQNIRLEPKSPTNISTWKTKPVNVTSQSDPVNGSTYGVASNTPNHRRYELIKFIPSSGSASVFQVPFKDSAVFNGREMMSTRVLNIDLDLLRRTNPDTTENWLPNSGIVYAFREDAVREDAIARPALGTWSSYETAWNGNPGSGPPEARRMNANPANPQDPPVNNTTGISPKPIDYYPDPDRRPYGFRLRNGTELLRTGANNPSNAFGLSFISDNPVYTQGDFNLHKTSGGTALEEFTQALQYDSNGYWSNFYSRKNLEARFAKDADTWRPAEILADAITILSDNFCDGSVEDGIITKTATPAVDVVNRSRYGCGSGNGYTSYLNQNRPTTANSTWQREIPGDNNSPIQISPNGHPYTTSNTTEYSGSYQNFSDSKPTNGTNADETRVNAVIISGIVPSRASQSYGGFHNFPRFIQNWNNLFISGSFIQLNFSAYATAPFDQDAWEQNENPRSGSNSEYIRYYGPPNRRWGYDVGLQYRPAGAASRRFTTPSTTRSEFYKELPVKDPYILRLRCATKSDGSRVDPSVSSTSCS